MSVADIWAHVPSSVRRPLSKAFIRRIMCDEASVTSFWEAREGEKGGDALKVQLKALDGAAVWIRPGTSDPIVLAEIFVGKYHLPPANLDPKVIWDLGANIGLAMAHMAVRFPEAHVYGVEIDPENAGLCRRNVTPWSHRCTVKQVAIWHEDAEVNYEISNGREFAARVTENDSRNEAQPVKARSLDSLLADENCSDVDYLKIDIEGAERHLFSGRPNWPNLVKALKVEVHPPYGVPDCVRDLTRLGFRARVRRLLRSNLVEAHR